MTIELTKDSLETFLKYADDAPNWSMTPWVSQGNITCTKAMRGNLSDLVQKGLIKIHDYGSKESYLTFTEEGIKLAAEHGHDLT